MQQHCLTSDIDDYDKDFITGERSSEGFYMTKAGIESGYFSWFSLRSIR